jgi:hypothetical protein
MALVQKQTQRPMKQNTRPRDKAMQIFDKGVQNICWRKESLMNKWCWENLISTCIKQKLDLCFSHCTNINSKWVKDLNVRSKILKLLQERIVKVLEHIGMGKNFLNRTQIVQ